MKEQSKIINKEFYERNTLKVAKDLLGCFLIREHCGKIIRAMIVETEAYHGEDDLACHASRGRTPRTEVMYGEPGHAYVYMIYGTFVIDWLKLALFGHKATVFDVKSQ
jgi:DNA-3-methyladenine glycosylase